MKFKSQKMVDWFGVKQLISTGIQTVISSLFGSYADKREIMGALAQGKEERFEYDASSDEFWFDYMADTADGFNPTYTMANLISQPELAVSVEGKRETIPRGDILILGGDEVYPTPEMKEYHNRLKGPFDLAFPWQRTGSNDDSLPHVYAIPGNHDWYDGLNNFLKVFCQERFLGNWKTKQTRSYFMIKLPHNYWLWAVDIQLNADIDKVQMDYFEEKSKEMAEGDNVILCTAEPSWVKSQLQNGDASYSRLRFFEEKYILNKGFNLSAVLTGDSHHYSSYKGKNSDGTEYYRLTAGGGGAFMNPTHQLPDELDELVYDYNGKEKEEKLTLQKTFPDKKTSRGLVWGNLLFPFKHLEYSCFIAGLYTFAFWLLQTSIKGMGFFEYSKSIAGLSFGEVIPRLVFDVLNMPAVLIFYGAIVAALVAFTDTKHLMLKGKGIIGPVIGLCHGIIHVVLFNLFVVLIANLNYNWLGVLDWYLLAPLYIAEYGLFAMLSGWGMGFYLIIVNILFNIHDDEAYSAIGIEGYKNFLRIKLTKEHLEIYSVGVTKVPNYTVIKNKGYVETVSSDASSQPIHHIIEKITI